MKNFKIEVISKKPKKYNGILADTGQIIIGNHKETFPIPLKDWSLEDYKNQWQEGLDRIKTHNESCLVVYFIKKSQIWLWTMYKDGNKIFFHNQLLIDSTVKEMGIPLALSDFNSQTCYQFIIPRIINERNEGIDEEGNKIEEWSINIE